MDSMVAKSKKQLSNLTIRKSMNEKKGTKYLFKVKKNMKFP